MTTLRKFLSIVLATALSAPSLGWAAVKSDVQLGVEVFAGDQDNAKFREYRYGTDSPLGITAKANVEAESETGRFNKASLDARTAEDLDLDLRTGSYGVYKTGLRVRRFGHNFAFGAKSMYAGTGTDNLTLPDAIQTYLQGSTSSNQAANRLNEMFAVQAGPLDLALRRDQVAFDFAWALSEPLSLDLKVNNEKRKGTRPFGAGFGFGNAIEIPEPIDYNTNQVDIGLEFAPKGYFGSLRYGLSAFSNRYNGVSYDNPFRITDSGTASSYSQSYQSGGSRGLTALAPDNSASHISAILGKDLPMHSKVTATASFGWLRQDDTLNQPTINTNVTGGQPSLPRTSAEAAVDTALYNLRFTSRPLKKLHVKANYNYSAHENNTSSITVRAVQIDGTFGGLYTPAYVSVIKRIGEVEAAYDILPETTLALTVENEHANYENGSALKENENLYKLTLDTERLHPVALRVGLEHSAKRSDYPDYVRAQLEMPWMRKYYAASRDQDRIVTMASYEPTDKLSTSLEYIYGVDDYPASEFGLQNSFQHVVSLDVGYAVTSRITVSPSYTLESYKARQRNRQWTPRGKGDPYDALYGNIDDFSNWTLESRDIIHTPGLGVEAVLIPEKLTMSASGSVSKADGTLDFSSVIGPTGRDNNDYDPIDFADADDSELVAFDTSFDYAVKKDVSVALGYGYRRWKIKDDLKYDGYKPVAVTGTGAYGGLLSMDSMYKPYNVHMVSLTGSYRF